MEQAPTGESRSGAKVAISLLAGLVVVIVLLPWHGMDTDPPQCLSIFDYRVPCGAGLAFAAGTATAGVLALLFWVAQRRRSLQTR